MTPIPDLFIFILYYLPLLPYHKGSDRNGTFLFRDTSSMLREDRLTSELLRKCLWVSQANDHPTEQRQDNLLYKFSSCTTCSHESLTCGSSRRNNIFLILWRHMLYTVVILSEAIMKFIQYKRRIIESETDSVRLVFTLPGFQMASSLETVSS